MINIATYKYNGMDGLYQIRNLLVQHSKIAPIYLFMPLCFQLMLNAMEIRDVCSCACRWSV